MVSGMLARLGSKLSWALLKREIVGSDAAGNKYYRQMDKALSGELIERRIVSYASGDYDPTTLPPAWLQWLQKTRDDAPDASVLAEAEEARRVMAERAASADAAAEKARRRWQEQSSGGGAGAGPIHQLGEFPGNQGGPKG